MFIVKIICISGLLNPEHLVVLLNPAFSHEVEHVYC